MLSFYLNLQIGLKGLYAFMFFASFLVSSADVKAERGNCFRTPHSIVNSTEGKVILITKTNGTEDGSAVGFTFSFAAGVTIAAPTTITYALSGPAIPGVDYVGPSSGTVTIPAGQNSASLVLIVSDDDIVEENETITLTAGTAINELFNDITVANSPQTVVIADNDVAGLTISDVQVIERNFGTTQVQLEVKLNKSTSKAFSVNFSTADGTATVSDNDYAVNSGTLIFLGFKEEIHTIDLTIKGDQKAEMDESFTVVLAELSETYNGRLFIASSRGSVLVRNDDAEIPLPLELLAFDAYISDKGNANVDWKTGKQADVSHFVVEHGSGGYFDSVAIVPVTLADTYHFAHYNAGFADSYYRLKIVDKNGDFRYSKVLKLRSGLESEPGLVVFPNPASSFINVLHPQSDNARISVFDPEGRLITVLKVPSVQSQSQVDMRRLSPGSYILKWENGKEKAVARMVKE